MPQKPGLANEPGYVPPAGPGQMHTHNVLPGEMSIGEAVGRGFQWNEADFQARRAAAKKTLGGPENADPRDTVLPVEKKLPAAKPAAAKPPAIRKAVLKPRSPAGRR